MDTVYGMGLLGALYFYIQHATNFSDGLLGIVKAVFWPALFVYEMISRFGIGL